MAKIKDKSFAELPHSVMPVQAPSQPSHRCSIEYIFCHCAIQNVEVYDGFFVLRKELYKRKNAIIVNKRGGMFCLAISTIEALNSMTMARTRCLR